MHPLLRSLGLNETRIVMLVVSIASICFLLRFLFALISDERVRKRQNRLIHSLSGSISPHFEEVHPNGSLSEDDGSITEGMDDVHPTDPKHHRTKMRWLIVPLLLAAGIANARLAELGTGSPHSFHAGATSIRFAGDRTCKTYFG